MPAQTPPPAQNGYVGFAGTIQVNPGVQADAVAGARRHAAGQPASLAGFTGIIKAVLNHTLGGNPPVSPTPVASARQAT